VGHDLRQKALYAIFYALLLIAIYISGRFEFKWTSSLIMGGVLIVGIYLLEALGLLDGGLLGNNIASSNCRYAKFLLNVRLRTLRTFIAAMD